MLVHASNNNFAWVMLFAVFTTVNPYGPILSWAGVVGFSAVDLVLVAATRGRLGYRPELLDEQPESTLAVIPQWQGRRGRRPCGNSDGENLGQSAGAYRLAPARLGGLERGEDDEPAASARVRGNARPRKAISVG